MHKTSYQLHIPPPPPKKKKKKPRRNNYKFWCYFRKHGHFIQGAVPVSYRPFHAIIFQKFLVLLCCTHIHVNVRAYQVLLQQCLRCLVLNYIILSCLKFNPRPHPNYFVITGRPMGTHVQKNQHMACLTGLPTGLNSTRLGHPLAWWVGGQ